MRISDWSSDVCSSDLAFVGEIFVLVVVFELALDQIDERRIALDATTTTADHTERQLDVGLIFGVRDQTFVAENSEHQIAPRGRALRIAPRVVVRRPLDHADRKSTRLNSSH